MLIVTLIIAGCSDETKHVWSEDDKPMVWTYAPTSVHATSAMLRGSVTAEGSSPVVRRGFICSLTPETGIDETSALVIESDFGMGDYTEKAEPLIQDTIYHVRAFAVNNDGLIAYGAEYALQTKGLVYDADGNAYEAVRIGEQTWLTSDLKTKHYANGDPITFVWGMSWQSITNGLYCAYEYDSTYAKTYGFLYNWYAATDLRGIAPSGYHVATLDDWQKLIEFAGGISEAASHLKATGAFIGSPTGITSDDAFDFSAKPGGARMSDSFHEITGNAYFWMATTYDATRARCLILSRESNATILSNYSLKSDGYSIRCVKN